MTLNGCALEFRWLDHTHGETITDRGGPRRETIIQDRNYSSAIRYHETGIARVAGIVLRIVDVKVRNVRDLVVSALHLHRLIKTDDVNAPGDVQLLAIADWIER